MYTSSNKFRTFNTTEAVIPLKSTGTSYEAFKSTIPYEGVCHGFLLSGFSPSENSLDVADQSEKNLS